MKQFIESLRQDQFVPPVTIGYEVHGEEKQNYIIDGQQRLTSLLLAYAGLFPKKDKFGLKDILAGAGASAGIVDPDDKDNASDILDWQFKRLITRRFADIEELLRAIPDAEKEFYKELKCNIDDEYLENHCLGFAYIVPQAADEDEQQEYYARVFRNMNYEGTKLDPLESRRALYYSRAGFTDFFEPAFCRKIMIDKGHLDYVRLLALLAEYHKDGNAGHLANGCKGRMEEYFVDFIFSMISDESDKRFGSFKDRFSVDRKNVLKISKRSERIPKLLTDLKIPDRFDSIISADMYMMGLVYTVLFLNQDPEKDKVNELKAELEAKIAEFRDDDSHKREPNNLGHLRERVAGSISIYGKYVHRG